MVGMRKMMDLGGRGMEFHNLMEGCCSPEEGVGDMFGVLDPSLISVGLPEVCDD
jgi:hypothetical protein